MGKYTYDFDIDIALCNKNMSKDLIVRYLITKLAPYFQRDVEFFYATYESQLEQYKNGFPNKNIFKIVCSSLCDFYVDLLREFNIKATKVQTNEREIPHFALVVEGTNGRYFVDPLKDLMRNQGKFNNKLYGAPVTSQGKILQEEYPDLITLSFDYINYLDKLLQTYEKGYSNTALLMNYGSFFYKRGNTMSYFDLPGVYNSNITSLKKLEFIGENLINLGRIYGPVERIQMYKYIFGKICEKEERNRIRVGINDTHDKILITHSTIDTFEKKVFEEVQTDEDNYSLRRIL